MVEYFNGSMPPDERTLEAWRAERDAPEPNYALWRRYFRSGNKKLKMLIVFGLEREPTDRALLSDLSFMHIFSPMLKELVGKYLAACDVEEDHAKFAALAQDFENHTYVFRLCGSGGIGCVLSGWFLQGIVHRKAIDGERCPGRHIAVKGCQG